VFRKKLAKIYYPIVKNHLYEAKGIFPIFKLSPNYKPPETSTQSTSSRFNKYP